jgi:hypothetical protein
MEQSYSLDEFARAKAWQERLPKVQPRDRAHDGMR